MANMKAERNVEKDTVVVSQDKSPEVQRLEKDVAAIRSPKQDVRPIIAPRVQLAEFTRSCYRAISPMEDTIEQITSPRYWIGLQHQLKRLDKIEVIPDDARFYAELLVLGVQQNHVSVALTAYKDLPQVDMGSDIPSNFHVIYAGPYELFRVMDGDKVLMTQIQTADMAKAWLRDHVASLKF